MKISRRHALVSTLSAGGFLGLRALATGIPATILANPSRAFADDACASPRAPQYLIISSSNAGDPFNANIPGTYEDPGIIHPADPSMAKTPLTLGTTKTTAAQPWSTLPQDMLARTSFIHHRSMTNSHGNLPKVLGLMGGVRRSESLVSLLSRSLAPCLGTIQPAPIALGPEPMTFQGRLVPPLAPTVLRDVLTGQKSPGLLSDVTLTKLRDDTLNQLTDIYEETGNVLQKRVLDNFVKSRNEVRSLSDNLLGALTAINNDGGNGQLLAAAALIKLNIAPVISVHLGFGSDNHADPDLARETSETVNSIGNLNTLWTTLQSLELTDKVTFGLLNVFGRTIKQGGTDGRAHAQALSATVLIGKNVKGSVCGGVEPTMDGADYQSRALDSVTGKASATGDISVTDSLGAVGKTMGAALGVPQSVLDDAITQGKVITGALAG